MSRRSKAHQSRRTTVGTARDRSFAAFLHRQVSRCAAVANIGVRRYVERCVRLASENAASGDLACERHGTYGGVSRTIAHGEVDDE